MGTNKLAQRSGHNPKRKIANIDTMSENVRNDLAQKCKYVGSPVHKRDPGDYDLTPPSAPRPGKTLCDPYKICKADAQNLLQSGFERGMLSVRNSNTWPEIVWAVSDAEVVFEAQLDNQEQGTYHGYPLQTDDPFREEVLREWKGRVT